MLFCGDLVPLESRLTKRSISDEAYQLKTQSVREWDQHLKEYNILQEEVRKILRRGEDGGGGRGEDNANPFGHKRQGKPGHSVRDRLKEIIRLMACEWAFRVRFIYS